MKKLNQSGFSLIELMIVVAIIGILAAIAIPNYQSFQRKSRQAEARSMLGAYYAASAASSAEFNAHLGNFVAIGFRPQGQLTYRISADDNNLAAFNGATLLNFNNVPNSDACLTTLIGACPAGAPVINQPGFGNGAAGGWNERPSVIACPAANVTNNDVTGVGNTFSTCASANLGTANNDVWVVLETKAVNNITSGI